MKHDMILHEINRMAFANKGMLLKTYLLWVNCQYTSQTRNHLPNNAITPFCELLTTVQYIWLTMCFCVHYAYYEVPMVAIPQAIILLISDARL